MSVRQLSELFSHIDTDKGGSISIKEFEEWMLEDEPAELQALTTDNGNDSNATDTNDITEKPPWRTNFQRLVEHNVFVGFFAFLIVVNIVSTRKRSDIRFASDSLQLTEWVF